jgi:predicted nuclease of predicted toxin-antitoxin system
VAGHDVAAVAEGMRGTPDIVVLQRAAAEARVVVTFDRDFGRLIYGGGAPMPAGVVLFRFVPAVPEEPGALLLELLSRGELILEARFSVVDRERIRQRPLPGPEGGSP